MVDLEGMHCDEDRSSCRLTDLNSMTLQVHTYIA